MLDLKLLRAIPPDNQYHFESRGSRFDFSTVSDLDLRERMITGLDMLYAREQIGGAVAGVINGIQARAGRTVRFFDDKDLALKGTGSRQPIAEAGGFSFWGSNRTLELLGSVNNQSTPVINRVDERICLYPATFTTFGSVVWGLWHELTHIFTPLNHGKWDSKTNRYADQDSSETQAWVAQLAALKACAPDTWKDPKDG